MRLGVVIDGADTFIRDFLLDWKLHYRTDIFSYHAIRSPILEGRLNDVAGTRAMRKFMDEHDAVFFEWAGPILVRASKLRPKTRLIARLHSWELFEFAADINWESIDRIVLVGSAMQRWFARLFPAEAHKIAVICNGIRTDRFVPSYRNNHGTIGMLGSLIPIKRVYEVILALYELRSRGYNFTLLLGGPSDKSGADNARYYAALQRLVSTLGMDDCVVFGGLIQDAEAFLAKVDIFVSNSYWESQHVALVEAMSTGCFCLGHRWDGIEDILPEENLYITNTELVAKIISYWESPEGERALKRRSLHEIAASRYDIELLKPKMRELIEAAKS